MERVILALKRDHHFPGLIKKYGKPDLKWGRGNLQDPFRALARSIVYQQVSGAAASSILKKFEALFGSKKFPTPRQVARASVTKLRSAGLSKQKIAYLKDLARKFFDRTIRPHSLHKMKNEEVIEHLTQVRGIGVWTAHMFLIFTLNRPDVLPTKDLGIQKGFKLLYGLKKLPNHEQMEKLAKPWRAYASYVSWYLWRIADGAKAKSKKIIKD